METNPYAPPKAEVAETVTPGDEDLASRGQRFLNMIIDIIAIYVLAFIVGIILAILRAPFLTESSVLFDYGFGIALWLLYYVPLEAGFGRTVGKLLTRTRVVMVDGTPPNILNVIGRTFARLVPFEAFSFFGSLAVGWHDSWSRTRVVKVRRGG